MGETEAHTKSLVGATIGGKFVIRELLGAGAMGAVFRADQEPLGRTVAVKVLNEELARDEDMVKRFHVEARAASRLNHPNTIAIIDFGQTPEGLLYLVMEFVRGRTLTELIRQDFPLPPARLIDLACQILAGLHEAHSQGVVHQDVKPDNILVERLRTGGDLVKIADFGIARLRGEEPEGEREVVSGTPEYMSPEQIRGLPVDARSDVYATGVVLYEALAGERPFDGGQLQVLRAHLEETPRAPTERRPDLQIDPALERLVLRALSKIPEERFETAAAFRTALASCLGSGVESGTVCASCRTVVPRGSVFCPGCGVRVARADVARAATLPAVARAGVSTAPGPATGPRPVSRPEVARFPLPFVGRDSELNEAARILSTRERARSWVLLGEPGSGKSRLCAEVTTRAAAAGYRVHTVNPDPTGLARSWYPIRQAVAALLSVPESVGRPALQAAIAASGLDPPDAPGLAELFCLEAPVNGMELAVRRRECAASALRVLRGAPNWKPTLLIFEDVERYDRPSVDLLLRLVEFPGDAPVHVILTSTPGGEIEWVEGAGQLQLQGLRYEAVCELVRAAGSPGIDATELAALTGGMPLHLEQRLRQATEGGAAGGESLADIVDCRVEALPPAARHALQAAAVLGTECDRRLVGRLIRNDESLEAGLEVLSSRGFVKLRGTSVAFTHPLVQELVLSGIPVEGRRQCHAKVHGFLRREGAPAAVVGAHGYHAGGGEQVVASLERAGREAERLFDDAGAVVHYRRAWELARRAVLGGEEDAEQELARVGVSLGNAMCYAGDLAGAEGVLRETLELCSNERALSARALRALARVAAAGGQPFERCAEHMRGGLGHALRSGDRAVIAETYLEWSTLLQREGDKATAASELGEGILIVTGGEGPRAEDAPPVMWRLALRMGELQVSLGEHAGACASAEAALFQATRVGSDLGAARAHSLLGDVYRAMGRHAEAAEERVKAVDWMRRLGDRRSTAELLFALAKEDLAAGANDRARAKLVEVRELSHSVEWRDGEERAAETLQGLG
jgi:eukaryotic-like serine/threonine-protein kinase